MGSKRNVDMSAQETEIKVVTTDSPDHVSEEELNAETSHRSMTTENPTKTKTVKAKKKRGKKYVAGRSMVDRTKKFELAEAVDLVIKTSLSKFEGTVTADLLVKEVGDQVTVTFPFSTGKSVKVAIASDELIKQIEAGQIDFDVLLSEPSFVPKLAKHAKSLGPKGLMPNPKNGTITDQPEKRKKELEKGAVTIKTERKFPNAHVVIGKTSMPPAELVSNLQTLVDALDFRLRKLIISASMGPGIRVNLG